MDLFPGIQLDPEHSLSRPTSPLGGLRDASFASVGAPSQGYDEAAVEMEPTVQRLDMAALAPVEMEAARPNTKRQVRSYARVLHVIADLVARSRR